MWRGLEEEKCRFYNNLNVQRSRRMVPPHEATNVLIINIIELLIDCHKSFVRQGLVCFGRDNLEDLKQLHQHDWSKTAISTDGSVTAWPFMSVQYVRVVISVGQKR